MVAPHAQLVTNAWLGGASLWMHHLAEKGYIVFTMDNRGSANRGIEFEQSVFGAMGILETADQGRAVEYLHSLPYVDYERMAVHGWSFGGHMTLSIMSRMPELFKVGVAGGPVVDWSLYEVMYTERYMDMPQTNPLNIHCLTFPLRCRMRLPIALEFSLARFQISSSLSDSTHFKMRAMPSSINLLRASAINNC